MGPKRLSWVGPRPEDIWLVMRMHRPMEMEWPMWRAAQIPVTMCLQTLVARKPQCCWTKDLKLFWFMLNTRYWEGIKFVLQELNWSRIITYCRQQEKSSSFWTWGIFIVNWLWLWSLIFLALLGVDYTQHHKNLLDGHRTRLSLANIQIPLLWVGGSVDSRCVVLYSSKSTCLNNNSLLITWQQTLLDT